MSDISEDEQEEGLAAENGDSEQPLLGVDERGFPTGFACDRDAALEAFRFFFINKQAEAERFFRANSRIPMAAMGFAGGQRVCIP